MLGLFPRRKMTGGLYFGPAGWTPERWQSLDADTLRIPLPTAADASSLVGRRVRTGQTIAQGGPDEPDAIAPCDGTLGPVVDVQDALHLRRQAITLVAQTAPVDAAPEPAAAIVTPPEDRASLAALLARTGVGQTSPWLTPLLTQIRELTDRPRALIINMLPVQPESALSMGLMRHDTERMLAAVKVLTKALMPRRTLVAVDRQDRRQASLWRKGARKTGLAVVRFLVKYPQANPTVLAHALLGAKLPVGQSPARQGIIMADPVALWALGGMILHGRPFAERPIEVFVAGENPRLVLAPIGTAVSALAGPVAEDTQVIANGVLAGVELNAENAIISQATEMVAFRQRPQREWPTPCFACGWCVDHCPTALNPVHLYELARTVDITRSHDAQSALHCIACGLCSYVCPTRLPLTEQVIDLREAIRRRRSARPEGGAS